MTPATGSGLWASGSSLQSLESQAVRFSLEVFVEGVFEYLIVLRNVSKQRHARSEFQIIGIPKYVFDRAALDIQYKLCALPQPRAENRVLQICLRLFSRRNGKLDRGVTMSQAFDLGKNEPHPMAVFAATMKF